MHQSLTLLGARGFLRNPTIALSSADTVVLLPALRTDGERYLGNALISLSAGINSILNENYGWAAVKFYYAAFYSARARLAKSDILMAYINQKPYSLTISPGQVLQKRKGQTHDAILKLFAENFPSDFLLSNQIENKDPITWLKDQRDFNNYKISIMTDPSPCAGLIKINKNNVRTMISTYLTDNRGAYTFDPEHAVLAWPANFVFATLKQYIGPSIDDFRHIEEATIRHIVSSFKDQKGPFSDIRSLFYPSPISMG